MTIIDQYSARALGDLLLLPEQRSISDCHGRMLRLRRREFQLLNLLAHHRQKVIGKFAIEDLIWQYGGYSGSNTVEVHLSSLRRKLRQLSSLVTIETIRGVGYRLLDSRPLS